MGINKPEQTPKAPAPQKVATPQADTRKTWRKKTTAEIVLEQGAKIQEEIQKLEEELAAKKEELRKFDEVRRIFGG